MSEMNRLANCSNRFQGDFKKVLCVCSAGLLRSPTAALVLSSEFNCNTRAAGANKEYALIPVDEVLLEWADEIVCMEAAHAALILRMTDKPIKVLGIPDHFKYRDPELMELIRQAYKKVENTVAK